MSDRLVIAAASSTPTDIMAPSCFDQLSQLNMELGHMTGFDNDHGVLILTQGNTCWDDIRFAFTDMSEWLAEQLDMAMSTDAGEAEVLKEVAIEVTEELAQEQQQQEDEQRDQDAADGVAQEADEEQEEKSTGVQALLDSIDDYTDKHMMLSMWSWDPKHVKRGESVGICVKPADQPEAYASCWLYKKEHNGVYTGPTSLLIDTKYMSAGTRLEDFDSVSIYPVPGMKGQWMCEDPVKILGRMRVSCARFTPKTFEVEDPSFEPHQDVTVMTYLTSRQSGRVAFQQTESTNGGFHATDSAFEEFKFNIEDTFIDALMGATFGYSAASVAGFAFTLASLTF